MKAEITKRGATSATLQINLDQEALAEHVEHTFNHLRGRVKAAGFRPGKAPDHIVERELGSDVVQSEVLDHAITHSYANAVRQHELPVIAQPQVAVSKFVPYTELEFTADVEILPEVKLADYKKLKVKAPEPKIEDAEIDQVVEDLRRRLAKHNIVDRPAKLGDDIMIDFAGSIDGRPIEGGSATNYQLALGSNSFIPGFEEMLVGVKAGESKSFEINFPKDYQATSLAGQKANFEVKVHQVVELDLPAPDDKFATEASPHQTMAELRVDITARLLEERHQAARSQYEQSVLDELVKASDFKVPQRLVDQQLEHMKRELLDRLGASGLDWEKYLQMAGQTDEQWQQDAKAEAERRVALAVVLTEVAKAEQLAVTALELDGEINLLKQRYTDKTAQEELDRPEVREDIYNHLLGQKTIAKLMEYVEANAK